jgi:MYXO-CTERM domain-containing protein
LNAELYDPVTNTWSLPGSPNQGRYDHTATMLGNGQMWVAGGYNGGALATAELYSISAALGTACGLATDCQSGFCVDGVCCNTACNAGVCDACAVSAGAATDGTCALLTGNACNDGNSCTQSDTCQAGVCASSNPVVCAAQDQCHAAGACNPATGICSNPAKADGNACNDGDGCTQGDTCQAGVCASGNPVVCTAQDQCHVAGVCNAATGACTNPSMPDSTPCADGKCDAGVCVSTPDCGGGGADSSGKSGDIDDNGDTADKGDDAPGTGSGWGCSVGGTPDHSTAWLSLGLLLAAMRRRRQATSRG